MQTLKNFWNLRQSRVRQPSLFLDEFGMTRMEDNTIASPPAAYEAKYPVILLKILRVTELLIVDWYYRRYGNQNGEAVVKVICQQ